jgi:hypothetical protein
MEQKWEQTFGENRNSVFNIHKYCWNLENQAECDDEDDVVILCELYETIDDFVTS